MFTSSWWLQRIRNRHLGSISFLHDAGACTYYNELEVDEGYTFAEALAERDRRLEEMEAAGADQRAMAKVRVQWSNAVSYVISYEPVN